MINASALGHLEAETEARQGAGLVQSPSEFRLEDVKKIAPVSQQHPKWARWWETYEQLRESMVLAEKPDGNSKSFSPSNQMLAPFIKCFRMESTLNKTLYAAPWVINMVELAPLVQRNILISKHPESLQPHNRFHLQWCWQPKASPELDISSARSLSH